MKLTTAQSDRAAGVMLGTACGDALGAGYEFGPAFDGDVEMKGGGGFAWAPGEWTDDTSMAVPILRAAATGRDLRDEAVLDEIVTAWVDWAKTAPDVGIQTRRVLSGIAPTAAAARESAKHVHDQSGRSGGNGSLMRTAPVALAYLDDPTGLAEAARAISDLTHYEEDAGDACVLWCLAIRHAVLTGELDVRIGLPTLAPDRAALWAERITVAEAQQPSSPAAQRFHEEWLGRRSSPRRVVGDRARRQPRRLPRTRGSGRQRHRHRRRHCGRTPRCSLGNVRNPCRLAAHRSRLARPHQPRPRASLRRGSARRAGSSVCRLRRLRRYLDAGAASA